MCEGKTTANTLIVYTQWWHGEPAKSPGDMAVAVVISHARGGVRKYITKYAHT